MELGQQYTRRRYHTLRLRSMELLRVARFEAESEGMVPVPAENLRALWNAIEDDGQPESLGLIR